MSPVSLDVLLRTAARSADWHREIVHRCAWCQRTVDGEGNPRSAPVVLGPQTVTTDGMCNACGATALARIASRRLPAAA